ncbi:hypothetical protein BECAL_02226 [Bellilinea caldifistulae]|uniref:Uncharacterized protein n=1 Tax=Bellilinea caldifistulae TaxID=360411 RepID=A0A0P6X305_9CHLR|nr:hypothetical protein [Bellilinea caldifistulae]KPL73781.1 hypothetical protein AC812_13340 [Bellilinea caldifistulae]GAP11044.1 hypothetical protein BECAL_02226 [Bellilinea caldifistulae]
MSRLINPESAGKQRTQLTKGVVLAIRELMKQEQADENTRDLAAFIGLALIEIGETIDISVQAWEKRGYWVKAERFRMEWEWVNQLGRAMLESLKDEDWNQVALLSVWIAQKLQKIQVAERNRLGTPWKGAWQRLLQTQK